MPSAAPRALPVPILTYHVIGAAPATAPYPELYVDPAEFRAEIWWLATHGYHGVTLREVYDSWTRGAALPTKPVVVSFDDGHPSHLRIGLPTLSVVGWPGVLNLHIGNLVPAQVDTLIRAGWEIASHTLTHRDLTTLDAVSLHREVAGSRAWIRGVFDVPVAFFCYPAGRYDARVIHEVRRAGYSGATTTDEGFARPQDGMWTLHRLRVKRSDGVRGLAARLGSRR